GRLGSDVVEARQLREAFDPEHALEEWCRAVTDGPAAAVVPACLSDEPALEKVRHRRIGGHAADPRDVPPRAGAEVRDDRERLECRLGEVPLRGPLEQARARGSLLAPRPERPAARDVLEHDPAPLLGEAFAHETERILDPLRVVVGCGSELLDRERRRSHYEQRLERPRELVERGSRDQAERTVHSAVLSSSALFSCVTRATRIGANGAACSIESSPARRSSSNARKADACSRRVISPTSVSKSKRVRRRRSERKRSRNCETGG